MPTTTDYRLLADLVLYVHWVVVAFVVGGLLAVPVGRVRGWSWIRHRMWRRVHLAVMLWVVVQAWLGKACPLTTWEMALRARAGDATYARSMIARYLGELLYVDAPDWVFTLVYTLAVLLVVVSWMWVPPAPRLPRAAETGAE